MGHKTRNNYPGVCVKNCANRGKKCKECIRYSEYNPPQQETSKREK